MARKNINIKNKDIFNNIDINVIPKNHIKGLKINSKLFEYKLRQKTNEVLFNFEDYAEDDVNKYPGTNPDKNEQPVGTIITTLEPEEGKVNLVVLSGSPIPADPHPVLLEKFMRVYANVKVRLNTQEYCFPLIGLGVASNNIKIIVDYSHTTEKLTYSYAPDPNPSNLIELTLVETETENYVKTYIIDDESKLGSADLYNYDVVGASCSNYVLDGDDIVLTLPIQFESVNYTVEEWLHQNTQKPKNATKTTRKITAISIVVYGDGYEFKEKVYTYGDTDSGLVKEINNDLLNNYTYYNNDFIQDQSSNAFSQRILQNYSQGKVYGKTYTTYKKFKSNNGSIILNGVSGKIIEPYDIVYFKDIQMIQDKPFVITGIEYSNENNEIEIQFKEFIGLDTFIQTPDFEVLHIRPDMISLPYTPELFAFSVGAYSVAEKQIKDVELKIDPDPMELQSGDYFRRTSATSIEGDDGLYIYKNGFENRLTNVLRYVGNFWETFEQDGYILHQLQNKNQINTKLTNLIHRIETEGDYMAYKCHIKGNLNEINEDLLNEGDCVVIIK